MTKNPLVNALLAAAYVALVASVVYYGPKLSGQREDTVLVPIAMLSLFVLSVAVMGYLFLYRPIQLYFGGEKARAVKLFLQTVAVFAGITLAILIGLFQEFSFKVVIFPTF